MSGKGVGLVYSEDFTLHQPGFIFIEGQQVILKVDGQRLVDPFYTRETLQYPFPLPYGHPHPERPERTTLIYDSLEAVGLLPELSLIQPQPITGKALEAVHTQGYVAKVRELAQAGGGWLGEATLVSPHSYEVGRLSAGASTAAVAKLLEGELQSAFVLSRPPGHHAKAGGAAGFCIFNNVAIAAREWLAHRPDDRVLIMDWDLHHGDGTQNIFYEDNRVFYFSMHQYGPPDLYPGTGNAEEIGTGVGLGFNLNVPVPVNCGDRLYLEVFETLVAEVTERFRPDIILVSAGQDGHFNDTGNIYLYDPNGGFALTAQCYHHLTRIVHQLAEKYCGGKYIALLEGGYNLRNLSNSVVNLVAAMLNLPELVTEQIPVNLATVNEGANQIIGKARENLR